MLAALADGGNDIRLRGEGALVDGWGAAHEQEDDDQYGDRRHSEERDQELFIQLALFGGLCFFAFLFLLTAQKALQGVGARLLSGFLLISHQRCLLRIQMIRPISTTAIGMTKRTMIAGKAISLTEVRPREFALGSLPSMTMLMSSR